jgi:hypothetical protein
VLRVQLRARTQAATCVWKMQPIKHVGKRSSIVQYIWKHIDHQMYFQINRGGWSATATARCICPWTSPRFDSCKLSHIDPYCFTKTGSERESESGGRPLINVGPTFHTATSACCGAGKGYLIKAGGGCWRGISTASSATSTSGASIRVWQVHLAEHTTM